MSPSAAAALGFVLILAGIPMIRRWLPPFRFDALLLPGLVMTDEIWYESHRRSGWELVMLGAGLIGLAAWSAHSMPSSADARDFLGVFAVLALLVAAARSVTITIRLSRERDFRR